MGRRAFGADFVKKFNENTAADGDQAQAGRFSEHEFDLPAFAHLCPYLERHGYHGYEAPRLPAAGSAHFHPELALCRAALPELKVDRVETPH